MHQPAGIWLEMPAEATDEAAKASKKTGSAGEALSRIAKIYRIEQDLRAQQLDPEIFVQNRQEQVLPILTDFKKWLDQKALQVSPSTLFSLIETAKANGLEPYRYLRYIFTKSPLATTQDDYQCLTAQYLDRDDFRVYTLINKC